MGDSIPSTNFTSTQQDRGESSSRTNPSQLKGSGPSTTAAKLNPDAKDYVPRAALTGGPGTNPSGKGASNGSTRNRRRRNPEANKTPNGNASEVGKSADTKGHNNSNTNKNRRSHGRQQRQASEAARIDDDDDIEINMDRPIEPAVNQQTLGSASAPVPASGSGTAAKDRHRDGRRKGKGKEVSNASSPKPQQLRGENGRSRASAADGQPESSCSGRGSGGGNSNSNNRRQRNRKGDLNGRTFPTAAGNQDQSAESSGSSRSAKRSVPRSQPRKFVHTVEEDRDLMAALTAGLSNSTYECMVCWDVIRPAHKTWNCQVCWAAFHLDCLSTWAKKSSEATEQDGDVLDVRTRKYLFQKSTVAFVARSATPTSTGTSLPIPAESCVAAQGIVPILATFLVTPVHVLHVVVLVLSSLAIVLRCVDTDFTFQTGRSCDQVCGELLGCGKHTCTSVCHAGLCPPCEETQEQRCYCGKHERNARCGDGEPRTTLIGGEEQTGHYECTETCNRPLACGHHECTKKCHPLDEEPGPCSARPEVVKTCPCGSKTVEELLMGKTRSSCTDPIPVCGGVCKKVLSCGHRCMQKCHLGECAPCKMVAQVDCRCGSTQVQRVCSDMGLYGDELPTCDRLCRGLRTCGKHQCTNRCCPAKNQPKSKKGDLAALEAHVCTLICGKKLQCGMRRLMNCLAPVDAQYYTLPSPAARLSQNADIRAPDRDPVDMLHCPATLATPKESVPCPPRTSVLNRVLNPASAVVIGVALPVMETNPALRISRVK
ncbi:FKBP12-associated protein [Mortierella sp. GBA30]|nr:FKBP12-associated protein [Mortierella sp. GBA30]